MANFKLDYTAEEVNQRLGMVLPVVELDEEVTASRAMTEAEAAKFDEVAKLGVPIIVKHPMAGMVRSVLCHYMTMPNTNIHAFSASVQRTEFMFTNSEGSWAVQIVT